MFQSPVTATQQDAGSTSTQTDVQKQQQHACI
jgi:hypothetical protein